MREVRDASIKTCSERSYIFDKDLTTGLSIIWNIRREARLMIDNEVVTIGKDCAIFLTEFHQIDDFQFERMNVM